MNEGGENVENVEQPQTELPNRIDPSLANKPDVPIVDTQWQVEHAQAALPVVVTSRTSHRGLCLGMLVLLLVLAVAGYWLLHFHNHPKSATTQKSSVSTRATTTTPTPTVDALKLDMTKNYGNKYASGIVPVGDGKYVTASPKAGYIYACSGYAQNVQRESGGAGKRGPWFSADDTSYDTTKKSHVVGTVMWQASFTNAVSGSTRTIITNDLPSHPTGIFPIHASDPAYAYDRNPNNIASQALTMNLAASPTYSSTPTCESGTVGVMLTGIMLFNGFDAGGRDAGAWEVQDNCDGHPQSEGQYHYHTLSSCIKDTSVKTVIGYGLDGFPITGPKVGVNGTLTTSDLDECHGIVSAITLDGKTVTMYHYVMTQDFPYSVSCFRGTPIDPPGTKPQPH
jgi:hypothetical protein